MAANTKESQYFTKQIFLKGLAVTYVFAFTSLYFQIPGLYGENGLLPAYLKLKEAEKDNMFENFKNKPTVLWLAPAIGLNTATCMELVCLLGTVISVIVSLTQRCSNAIFFFVLWFLYFSLYQVGQTFLWFQWDILLLEIGFLAIFVADIDFGFEELNTCGSIGLWLLKWLLFRLMFQSGVVKLTSGCPTWWGLTALNFHYESQCIPTPLAWYAHQLPDWFQRLSVALTFVIEIALPFLFFAPVRWLRLFSAYAQVFLMILIMLTGNYNFFNFLTILLCVAVFDDNHFGYSAHKEHQAKNVIANSYNRLRKLSHIVLKISKVGVITFTLLALLHYTMVIFDLRMDDKQGLASKITFGRREFDDFLRLFVPISIGMGAFSLALEIGKAAFRSLQKNSVGKKLLSFARVIFYSSIAVWFFCVSLVPYTDIERTSQEKLWPILYKWHRRIDHFQTANAYGLFRRMTGVGGRPEIIIEGSNSLDGPWKEYDFFYKPGKLKTTPTVCIPHQPRLDWQMWFAALGSYHHNPWFINLIDKLLEGEKDVLALLDHNPFPKEPPNFIRSTLYQYHYTHLPKNTSGILDGLRKSRSIKKWWWRSNGAEYTPNLDKNNIHVKNFLQHFGLGLEVKENAASTGNMYELILSLRAFLHRLDPTYTMNALALLIFIGNKNVYSKTL